MSQRIQVLEYSTPKVNVAAGVITGVKIIGVKSRNGYGYPAGVLRKAKTLYENAPVFMLHPSAARPGTRKLADHFGSLQNVRERGFQNEITGLFGDLHVKLTHPMAKGVLEAASSARFGLSHNAVILMNDDQSEVTEIVEVNSVDLVESPATTKNLFEERTVTKEQPTGFPRGGEAEFEAADMEQFSDQVAAKVLERMDEQTGAGREGGGGTRRSPRLTALEDRTDDQVTGQIGNTHEDFLGALRGFKLTNG